MPERWYYPDTSPYLLWLDQPEEQAEENLTVLATNATAVEIPAEARELRPRRTTSPLRPLDCVGAIVMESE